MNKNNKQFLWQYLGSAVEFHQQVHYQSRNRRSRLYSVQHNLSENHLFLKCKQKCDRGQSYILFVLSETVTSNGSVRPYS